MEHKTLEQLDYFRIRDTVSGFCMSQEGKESLQQRLPALSLVEVHTLKNLAQQWSIYINSGKPCPLTGWEPIHTFLPVLKVSGASLQLEEIYGLGQFCLSVKKIKALLANLDFPLTDILALVEKIPDLSECEHQIFRVIDTSGQIRDLPEIRAIRNTIVAIRKDIDQLIRKYTGDSKLSDALQSTIPVLRTDRQVLAVKANFRGRVKGIVHEVSQTGQTLYIEPEDVVQKNNDLLQEEFALSQEIRRILKELTAQISDKKEDFEYALKLMIELDTAFGAARWGAEVNGIYASDCENPEFSESMPLTLLQARHPLLGNRAVPITVQFQKEHRVLIITGPNTGGKTVTLKTIALFALLNQSGFPIPAAEGTYLPLFTNIFADIGDEQSLDQSLSTFSGHMKNIGQMLSEPPKGADEKSLVLLDELGSGTDPQEGGAIAMAALDTLINRNSFVLVTTHHGILKNYGYTHPTCINASVDFDEDTLSPTYRILMGVPGESHALDIAKRSGLPEKVLAQAENYMTNQQADVSALIKGLNAKHEELAILEKEFREKERHIQEKWRRVDLKDLKLRQKEMELRDQGYRRSREFLDENRKMLENLVRELREGEVTRDKTIKVKQSIAQLSTSVEAEKEALEQDEELLLEFQNKVENTDTPETDKTFSSEKNKKNKKKKITFADIDVTPSLQKENHCFEIGTSVLVGTARRNGLVVGEGKKGSWLVQVGSLKMTVKEKDMIVAPKNQDTDLTNKPSITVEMEHSVSYGTTSDGKTDKRIVFGNETSDKPAFELRLLGMRYEDAMKALERQLDLASMHNLHEFSVIHGKGNGILQQGVQDYLSHYPGVSEFHFAPPEDGGTGKTYVKLS